MPNIRPYKLHHDDLGFLVCRNCGRRIEIEEAGHRHVGNGQRLCSSVGEKAEYFRAEPLHVGDAVRFLVSPVSGRLMNLVMTCSICGVGALRSAGDGCPWPRISVEPSTTVGATGVCAWSARNQSRWRTPWSTCSGWIVFRSVGAVIGHVLSRRTWMREHCGERRCGFSTPVKVVGRVRTRTRRMTGSVREGSWRGLARWRRRCSSECPVCGHW